MTVIGALNAKKFNPHSSFLEVFSVNRQRVNDNKS
jgi:hypothetical protein